MDTKTRVRVDVDDIGLNDLLNVLWRRKRLIIGVTVACGLGALGATPFVTKQYEATIIVSPVETEPGSGQGGALSSLASQFGSLASIAGIATPSDTRKAENVAVLKSRALTEHYVEENHLLPVLFAKQWDPQKRGWKPTDPAKAPTLWKANQLFTKHIRKITTDSKTGLVTMTIEWKNPQEAATWANGLVRMTNDYMRQKAIAEAGRNIAYLTAEAARTDLVGVRQAIYSVLENEIDKEMLARGTDEYALKVIDPAQAPEKPSYPLPWLWLVVGLVGGLTLSVLLALALEG
jgi:uncharacterized protein involved in exopolysaccharide biosynthesis